MCGGDGCTHQRCDRCHDCNIDGDRLQRCSGGRIIPDLIENPQEVALAGEGGHW
jgi:hypothetical protein